MNDLILWKKTAAEYLHKQTDIEIEECYRMINGWLITEYDEMMELGPIQSVDEELSNWGEL